MRKKLSLLFFLILLTVSTANAQYTPTPAASQTPKPTACYRYQFPPARLTPDLSHYEIIGEVATLGIKPIDGEIVVTWEEQFMIHVNKVSIITRAATEVTPASLAIAGDIFGFSFTGGGTIYPGGDTHFDFENIAALTGGDTGYLAIQSDGDFWLKEIIVYLDAPTPFDYDMCVFEFWQTQNAPEPTDTPTPTQTPECEQMCQAESLTFTCASPDSAFSVAPFRSSGVCPDRLHFPVTGDSGVEIYLGDQYRIIEVSLFGWNAWNCPQMQGIRIHVGSQTSNPQNMSGSMASTFPPVIFNPPGYVVADHVKITGHADAGGNCSTDYLAVRSVSVRIACVCDFTATPTPTPSPDISPTPTPTSSRTPIAFATPTINWVRTPNVPPQTRTPQPSRTPEPTRTPQPSQPPPPTSTPLPPVTPLPTSSPNPTRTPLGLPTELHGTITPWATHPGIGDGSPMPGTPDWSSGPGTPMPGGTYIGTPEPNRTRLPIFDDFGEFHDQITNDLGTAQAQVDELPDDITTMLPSVDSLSTFASYVKWLFSSVALQEFFGQQIYVLPLYIFYGLSIIFFVSAVMVVNRIILWCMRLAIYIIKWILKIIPGLG